MAYTECEKIGKMKRLDGCLKIIKAAVGIPEENTKFHSIVTKFEILNLTIHNVCNFRVLRDVHDELKVKMKFSIEDELKFINLFSLYGNFITNENLNFSKLLFL